MLNYRQALRAIGQDLDGHGAVAFEITVTDKEYVVQCDCDLPPPENLLSLRYSDKILEQIDSMGRLKRTGVISQSSTDTLAAALRSVGVYMDRENGRLLRISNYEFAGPEIAFRIQFALADGTQVENDLSKSALDKLSISLLQERK